MIENGNYLEAGPSLEPEGLAGESMEGAAGLPLFPGKVLEMLGRRVEPGRTRAGPAAARLCDSPGHRVASGGGGDGVGGTPRPGDPEEGLFLKPNSLWFLTLSGKKLFDSCFHQRPIECKFQLPSFSLHPSFPCTS